MLEREQTNVAKEGKVFKIQLYSGNNIITYICKSYFSDTQFLYFYDKNEQYRVFNIFSVYSIQEVKDLRKGGSFNGR